MSAALAQAERATVCRLFEQLGPDAPTLCEGWRTADLAAHLYVRERRPDAGPGIVVSALAPHTARVQDRVRDRRSWADLVDAVRRGPPWPLRPFDGPMNTVEFFIHVEDVRRAQSGWAPRPLPDDLARALWARHRLGAKGAAAQAGATVTFEAPGLPPVVRGRGPAVTVRGDAGEQVLFGSGRQSVARVELGGDPAAIERLRSARLGL